MTMAISATPNTPNTSQASAVTNAAKKYNVPQNILWGVWGMETTFGANVKTSSAGAVGDFQFLPSTAGRYGYPLTNTPSQAQLQQQADAAAHYLSDLYKQHGNSWDAALRAYSGGGYGLSQVLDKTQHLFSGALTPNVGNVPGVAPAAQAVSSTAGALSSIANLITSGSFWLRLGEAIAGVILLAMALRTLSGKDTTPITVAQGAAKKAAGAATMVAA